MSSGTWGITSLIETNELADAYAFQIALDPNGNAIAAWRTQYDMWANCFGRYLQRVEENPDSVLIKSNWV